MHVRKKNKIFFIQFLITYWFLQILDVRLVTYLAEYVDCIMYWMVKIIGKMSYFFRSFFSSSVVFMSRQNFKTWQMQNFVLLHYISAVRLNYHDKAWSRWNRNCINGSIKAESQIVWFGKKVRQNELWMDMRRHHIKPKQIFSNHLHDSVDPIDWC